MLGKAAKARGHVRITEGGPENANISPGWPGHKDRLVAPGVGGNVVGIPARFDLLDLERLCVAPVGHDRLDLIGLHAMKGQPFFLMLEVIRGGEIALVARGAVRGAQRRIRAIEVAGRADAVHIERRRGIRDQRIHRTFVGKGLRCRGGDEGGIPTRAGSAVHVIIEIVIGAGVGNAVGKYLVRTQGSGAAIDKAGRHRTRRARHAHQ
ncbi:hypothetical protein D3C81_1108530 [compost metagenome]